MSPLGFQSAGDDKSTCVGSASPKLAEKEAQLPCTLTLQGTFMKVTYPSGQPPWLRGARRGRVTGFSRSSARRLKQSMARMDEERAGGFAVFTTVTYPSIYPSAAASKRDLDTLLKRLRRLYPRASGFWKIEPQERGAPHYHMVIFGLPKRVAARWDKQGNPPRLRAMWAEVIGLPGQWLSVNASLAKTWRGAMAYMSKYMCKPAHHATPSSGDARGRRCGGAGQVPGKQNEGTGTADQVSGEANHLDYPAYLTARKAADAVWHHPGRFWGVFNRKALPFGECRMVEPTFGAWFWKLRRVARRAAHGAVYSHSSGAVRDPVLGRRPMGGYSLFLGVVEDWVRFIETLSVPLRGPPGREVPYGEEKKTSRCARSTEEKGEARISGSTAAR